MPAQNPLDALFSTTPAPVATPPPSGGSSNPLDSLLSGGSAQAAPAATVPSSSNPLDNIFGSPSSPLSGQPSGPTGPASHLYQDETQPWYKRAWDWANTPVTESVFGLPESREGAGGFERGVEKVAGGLTSPLSLALTAATFGTGGAIESAGATALKEAATEAGGRLFADAEIPQMEKAAQIAVNAFKEQKALEPVVQQALEAGGHDVGLLQKARDLLSPFNRDAQLGNKEVQAYLSKVGLTSEQRAALEEGELSATEREAIAPKNGGFSDAQLADLAKTGETVSQAKAGFKPIEDALKEAGIDPSKWKQAQDILYKNGLTEGNLLGGNLMERGAFQILRKAVPTLPIAVTARAAKTALQLLNGGFTYQQLEMGAQMSPQFLDALKSGDYDKAMEYGTEMAAGYGMGVLGATHALHTAGELFKPLVEEGKFRPNDEWLAVDRTNKEREAQHAVAEQHAIDIDQHARQLLGHEEPRAVLGDSSEVKALKQDELAETFAHAETGSDAEKAAAIASALREADGREGRVGTTNDVRNNDSGGQAPPGTPLAPEDIPTRTNTEVAHSNDSGEVRIGADGRPVVWLSPSAWSEFNHATEPGSPIKGVSYAPDEVGVLGRSLAQAGATHSADIQELFQAATTLSKQGLLTTAAHPDVLGKQAIPIVSEELHHTWQRELSQDGDIINHLNPDQFIRLRGIIPEEWSKIQDEHGYDPDPVVRVVETAAQFLAGRAEGVISPEDQFKFLKEYFREVQEKHGKEAFANLDKINEIARQHVEDINAQTTAATRAAEQRTTGRSVASIPEGGQRPAGLGQEKPGESKGLKARELHEDEVQHPIGFVSPNVHNLPNVQDAEFRLNSRPQKLAENLSKDFAEALPGVKAVVRPAIGHWEGGAENSTIQRFAPGTDPDAVEYHNAFVTKAGYQNMGAGFIPGAGSDKLFQFRVPLGTADAAQIGQVLEAHGIPGDTIEPVPGGHLVHVVSPGDTLRARVAEAASRLDAGNIGETNGRAFQHGDYESRDAAQRVLDTRLAELESKHPTWSPVRKAFESRPDYVGLSQLTRQPREPFVNAVHGTRAEGLDTVSPEKQFTGPQKGAEKARAEAFPKDYVKKSYWRVPGTHGERFYENQPYQYKARFNSENLYPYVDDPEKLLPAAQQEAAARGIQNQPGAIGTIYERMMKDSGYDGYYHPSGEIATFKDTPVEHEMREGTSPLSGQVPALGLAARDWGEIKKYLTPEEQDKHNTDEKKNSLVTAFNALPDAEEWSDAVKAGRAGQMWYERSSRAFDALLDSGFKALHPADKDKFLNFVAALSPVQPVKTNLVMALEQWAKWDKAGRPTDVVWKDGKPNKSAKLYQMMRRGVDLQSRLGNSIRALQGEPLSGPKVSAFTKNLGEDVNRVTNDTWMAVLAGQDPGRINKPAVYDSMSAKIREAAETHGIAPRQAQAAAWSFIKSLAELSGWGNDRWIPPQEIVKQGLLTPELVAAHSADFADLLQNDPQIRGLITKLGGDLNAFDEKLKSYVPERPAQGEAPAVSDRLLNAAGRLEAARTNSAIQRHLEAKSGPQGNFNFDQATDFNPAYMDQHISGGTGIGAKYIPLYARERPNNGQLPSNIDDMVQNNKFKDQPKEYKDRVIRAYERVASGTSSDRVLQASKYLRDEQDKNWQIGSANDLLHNYIEDYMTRVYKDQNPEGKVILSNAKQGRYATNVNMARQRVYESTLTALLKSPKELFLDPVQTTAQGRAQLIKAAANRQLIDKLRDAGVRASDGRPAVILSGTGRVVTGQNGEDPKTFVDPNRVRKINLSDDMVEGLKKNGDFDRFLEDGTLRDITPYIHPNNIQTAISRMEDQAGRREAQYDAVENNKLRTDIMLLKSMVNNGDFSGLKEFNDAQPKKYAWDPQDYVSLDNGAMKGWNFVTNDSAGNGVLVRSDIKVHPEFAEYLKNRLGLNPSTIGKNPIGKALLGAGTKLKHTLLSLSPFHMVQIALRGVMTGVNPFTLHAPDLIHGAKVDPMDPNSPTKMYKMVEQGMTVGTDYRAMQEHSEGVAAGGSALRLIPGVGKTLAGSMDWFQDFLFRRYIPAIKAVAAEHMFDEYQRLHPEWSTDKVARMAGTHANDSFGGINWKAMGRSATTQDWGRLMLLAPDWLESEMRSGIRLFNGDDGGLGRAQVAKMALGLWGIARVLNLLTTGNAHYEAPFGLAVKNKEGKETVFGIRTLPTDLLHAADDPVGFIKGRLSPTVRMGQELLTQRDQFGRKLAPEDMWVDIFRNMAPIAAQSIGQAVSGTGPEIGNAGQVAKALGATAQVYRTPAQKLAAELASNHNEDGPVDRNQMARHRQVMQMEDQLRSGAVTWPDLVKLTYQTDQLKESELKKIQNNFKKTQGMSPDMASLYTRAARLPAAEYLQLLDQMNPQEKAALSTLTLQVQKRYLNKAKKEMTPEERSKDPVFNRFMKMIPQTQQQQITPQPQSFYTPPQTEQTPLQKEVAYLYTATHPQTRHKVGSNDGQNWVDHQTGEPVNG